MGMCSNERVPVVGVLRLRRIIDMSISLFNAFACGFCASTALDMGLKKEFRLMWLMIVFAIANLICIFL
ncbi:hypothetical protein D3C84_1147250 [compost metagenome]